MDDLKHSQLDDVGRLFEVVITRKHTQPSPGTWETMISDFESPKINEKEIADGIRQHLKLSELFLLSIQRFFINTVTVDKLYITIF